ncbi:MAG: serine/threonine protein kinase [Myxococcales bacterium]|nr:serine/threonine protein kinase [Myxococcales bacterium]
MRDDTTDPTAISSSGVKKPLIAGRYEVERRLGSGGMGTVYLAKQVGVGNRVALKFLAPQLCHDEAFVQRFLREARVSLEVTHPGAAQLLDAGRDADGQLYIAFEYVEGEDLRARLERDGAMPFDEARQVALKVAEVLAFAHARGVVHRDVKPENVRIRKDLAGTHVKVLDFGIARFTQDAGARLTAEGGLAGTPRYMAPEQIKGAAVDARADLYALGLLVFEMMTGREAHPATSTALLLLHQLQEPLPRLEDAQPARDFPALDAVLAKACAKDPSQRYPDMAAFIGALMALPDPGWRSAGAPLRPAVETESKQPTALATPLPPQPPLAPIGGGGPGEKGRARGLVVPALLGLVLLLLGGVAALLLRPPPVPVTTTVVTAPPPLAASPCPALDTYEPSISRLSVPELEERVLKSRIMMPSQNKKQLEMLRATVGNYAPEKRDCMYRSMLAGSVASEQTMLKSVPENWGQAHEVEELRAWFLDVPLQQKWTMAQRQDVLDQIDSLFIASLKKEGPGDEAYWQRMYYGIELACEATDATLERFQAKRPSSCLNLTPRH